MFRSCTGLNTRGLYPTHDPYVSKPIPLCTGTGSDGYGHGLPRKTPGQPVPFPNRVSGSIVVPPSLLYLIHRDLFSNFKSVCPPLLVAPLVRTSLLYYV